MLVSDLHAKYRNDLIKALGELIRSFKRKFNKKNTILVAAKNDILLLRIVSMLEENDIFCVARDLANRKDYKRFMGFFDENCNSRAVVNDLFILLNGFYCTAVAFNTNGAQGECEKQYDRDIANCFDECRPMFVATFCDVKRKIEQDLIRFVGDKFLEVVSRGKCRVFSREKCKTFVRVYLQILNMFLYVCGEFGQNAGEDKCLKEQDECYDELSN